MAPSFEQLDMETDFEGEEEEIDFSGKVKQGPMHCLLANLFRPS